MLLVTFEASLDLFTQQSPPDVCVIDLHSFILFNQSSVALEDGGGAATARNSVHYVIVEVKFDIILYSKTLFDILVCHALAMVISMISIVQEDCFGAIIILCLF